jgi:general secretion pathway protein E
MLPLSSTEIQLIAGLSREFLLHHRVCPQEIAADGRLVLAAAEDAFLGCLEDFALLYNRQVRLERVETSELEQMVERLAATAERPLELKPGGEDDDFTTDIRDLANQPPVIRYVNLLVRDAYDAGASDIHLESSRDGLNARYRLDGVLVQAPEPPAELRAAVISRIKLLAELDIAERRRPQDGRIRVRMATRELDLRVSTVPTHFGESVVLRLLERGGRPVLLKELGMPAEVLTATESVSRQPHGMLLVTGPTGSGKTTTLYAALDLRSQSTEKIVTVEDPIEYRLPRVTQVPVHRVAGISFASALRSILRQDPDVVMVGEMRDSETAEVAIQAAMTGHLVLSTLHTNNAVSALPRLLDLGIPDYLIATTLDGVIAQRLVRRVCEGCMEYHAPSDDAHRRSEAAGFELPAEVAVGVGCEMCRRTGYRGRIGVFEMLKMTDDLRREVTGRTSSTGLREAAKASGLLPLVNDAWTKVISGLTTPEEVMRVIAD